jgi:TP901 family phage tail tape measure protein
MIDTEVRFVRIEKAKQKAQRELNRGKKLELHINEKAFSQPLGKITAQASEFNKSLEASNARVLAFGASVGVMNAVGNAFAALVKNSIEFKKILQDVNVILNLNQSQLNQFGSELFKVSQNTAQSFNVAAEAALEFSRQGLNLEEVLQRTNAALMLTRITSLDAASAVKGLTAAVNGFAEAGLTTAEIVDKLSAVDVRFAVSSEDLINALSRSSAVAQDAGVSFDQLIGAVTAAQQITARGGNVIGNSFKTIFTRIGRSSTINALGELGIAVKDVEGNTLPAIKIMDALAKTYDTLGASTRSAVAEQVGGVFQINILKAIMKDLSREQSISQKATLASANAFGEAAIKNERLNETLSATATQAGLELKKLSAVIGDLTLDETLTNLVGAVKGGATFLNDIFGGQDGEEEGSKIARGILKGVSNVLSGPGVVMAATVIFRLFGNLKKFAAEAFQDFSNIKSKRYEQKQIEESINNLLNSDSDLRKQMLSLGDNRISQEKKLLDIIKQQTQLVQSQQKVARNLAPRLQARGVQADLTIRNRAATGQVPNFSKKTEAQQASKLYNRNVTEDDAYATTITKNNKKEKVIVNNQEEIITKKDFKTKYNLDTDGDAILPPKDTNVGKQRRKEMFEKIGAGANALKYKNINHKTDPTLRNKGFIPNFQKQYAYADKLGYRAKERLDTGRGRKKDIVSANIIIDKINSSEEGSVEEHRMLATKFYNKLKHKKDPYKDSSLKKYKNILNRIVNPKNINSTWNQIDKDATDNIVKILQKPTKSSGQESFAVNRIQGALFEGIAQQKLQQEGDYSPSKGNQPFDGVIGNDKFVEVKSQKRIRMNTLLNKAFNNYILGNSGFNRKNQKSESIHIPGEYRFVVPSHAMVIGEETQISTLGKRDRKNIQNAYSRREKVKLDKGSEMNSLPFYGKRMTPNFAKNKREKFPRISQKRMEDNLRSLIGGIEPDELRRFSRGYEDYNNLIKAFSGPLGYNELSLASAMAAVSPSNPVENNVLDMIELALGHRQKMDYKDLKVYGTGSSRKKAYGSLSGEGFGDEKKAPKTNSFINNMMDPFNPDRVTVDYRATNQATNKKYTTKSIPDLKVDNRYGRIENAFKNVAGENQMVPSGLQAALWIHERIGTTSGKAQSRNRGLIAHLFNNPEILRNLSHEDFRALKLNHNFTKKEDELITIPNFSSLHEKVVNQIQPKNISGLKMGELFSSAGSKAKVFDVLNNRGDRYEKYIFKQLKGKNHSGDNYLKRENKGNLWEEVFNKKQDPLFELMEVQKERFVNLSGQKGLLQKKIKGDTLEKFLDREGFVYGSPLGDEVRGEIRQGIDNIMYPRLQNYIKKGGSHPSVDGYFGHDIHAENIMIEKGKQKDLLDLIFYESFDPQKYLDVLGPNAFKIIDFNKGYIPNFSNKFKFSNNADFTNYKRMFSTTKGKDGNNPYIDFLEQDKNFKISYMDNAGVKGMGHKMISELFELSKKGKKSLNFGPLINQDRNQEGLSGSNIKKFKKSYPHVFSLMQNGMVSSGNYTTRKQKGEFNNIEELMNFVQSIDSKEMSSMLINNVVTRHVEGKGDGDIYEKYKKLSTRSGGFIPSFADSVINTNEVILEKDGKEAIIPPNDAKNIDFNKVKSQGFKVKTPKSVESSLPKQIVHKEKSGARKYGYNPGSVIPYQTKGKDSGKTVKQFISERGLGKDVPNFADYLLDINGLDHKELYKILDDAIDEKQITMSEFVFGGPEDMKKHTDSRGHKIISSIDDVKKLISEGEVHNLIGFHSKHKDESSLFERVDKENTVKNSGLRSIYGFAKKFNFIGSDESDIVARALAAQYYKTGIEGERKEFEGKTAKVNTKNQDDFFHMATAANPILESEIKAIKNSDKKHKIIRIKPNTEGVKSAGTTLSFEDKKEMIKKSLPGVEGLSFVDASRNKVAERHALIGNTVERIPEATELVNYKERRKILEGGSNSLISNLPKEIREDSKMTAAIIARNAQSFATRGKEGHRALAKKHLFYQEPDAIDQTVEDFKRLMSGDTPNEPSSQSSNNPFANAGAGGLNSPSNPLPSKPFGGLGHPSSPFSSQSKKHSESTNVKPPQSGSYQQSEFDFGLPDNKTYKGLEALLSRKDFNIKDYNVNNDYISKRSDIQEILQAQEDLSYYTDEAHSGIGHKKIDLARIRRVTKNIDKKDLEKKTPKELKELRDRLLSTDLDGAGEIGALSIWVNSEQSKQKREMLGLEIPDNMNIIGDKTKTGNLEKIIAFNSNLNLNSLTEDEKQRFKDALNKGSGEMTFKRDDGSTSKINSDVSLNTLLKWKMAGGDDEIANRYGVITELMQSIKTERALDLKKSTTGYIKGGDKILKAQRHNEKEIAALYPKTINPMVQSGFVKNKDGDQREVSWVVDFLGTGLNEKILKDPSKFRSSMQAGIPEIIYKTATELFNLPVALQKLNKNPEDLKRAFAANVEDTQTPVLVGNMFDIIVKGLTEQALSEQAGKKAVNQRIDIPKISENIKKLVNVPQGIKQLEVKGNNTKYSKNSVAHKILLERGLIAKEGSKTWSGGDHDEISLEQFEKGDYIGPDGKIKEDALIALGKTNKDKPLFNDVDAYAEDEDRKLVANFAKKIIYDPKKKFDLGGSLTPEQAKERQNQAKLSMGVDPDSEDRLFTEKQIIGIFPDGHGPQWARGFVKKGGQNMMVDFVGTSLDKNKFKSGKKPFEEEVKQFTLDEMTKIASHHGIIDAMADLNVQNPKEDFRRRLSNSIEETQTPVFSGNVFDVLLKTFLSETLRERGMADPKFENNARIDIPDISVLSDFLNLSGGLKPMSGEIKNSRTQDNFNSIAHKILVKRGLIQGVEGSNKIPGMKEWAKGEKERVKHLTQVPFLDDTKDSIQERAFNIKSQSDSIQPVEGFSSDEDATAKKMILATRMLEGQNGESFAAYLEKELHNHLINQYPSDNPKTRNIIGMIASAVGSQAKSRKMVGGEMFESIDHYFTKDFMGQFEDGANAKSLRSTVQDGLNKILKSASSPLDTKASLLDQAQSFNFDFDNTLKLNEQLEKRQLEIWDKIENDFDSKHLQNRANNQNLPPVPKEIKRKLIQQAAEQNQELTDLLRAEADQLFYSHYHESDYEGAAHALREQVNQDEYHKYSGIEEGTLAYVRKQIRTQVLKDLETQREADKPKKHFDFEENHKFAKDALSHTLESLGITGSNIKTEELSNKVRFGLGGVELEADLTKEGRIDIDSLKTSTGYNLDFADRLDATKAMQDQKFGKDLKTNLSGDVIVNSSLLEDIKKHYKETRLNLAGEQFKDRDVAKIMSRLTAMGVTPSQEIQEAFFLQTQSGDKSKFGKQDFIQSTYLKDFDDYYKNDILDIRNRIKQGEDISYLDELDKALNKNKTKGLFGRFFRRSNGFVPNFAATKTGSEAVKAARNIPGAQDAINREVKALTSRGYSHSKALQNTQLTVRNNGFIPSFAGEAAVVTNRIDEGHVNPSNVDRAIYNVHKITKNNPKFSRHGMATGFVPNFADNRSAHEVLQERISDGLKNAPSSINLPDLKNQLYEQFNKFLELGNNATELSDTLNKIGVDVKNNDDIGDAFKELQGSTDKLDSRIAELAAQDLKIEEISQILREDRNEEAAKLSGKVYERENMSMKKGLFGKMKLSEETLSSRMRFSDDVMEDGYRKALGQERSADIDALRHIGKQKNLSVQQTLEEVKRLNLSKEQTKAALKVLGFKEQEVKAAQRQIKQAQKAEKQRGVGMGFSTALFSIPMGMGMLQEQLFGQKKRYELSEGQRRAQGAMEGANSGVMIASFLDGFDLPPKAKMGLQLASIAVPALVKSIQAAGLSFKDLAEKAQDGAAEIQQDLNAFSQYLALDEKQKSLAGSLTPLQQREIQIQKTRARVSIKDPSILKDFDAAAGSSSKQQEIKLKIMEQEAQKSLMSQIFTRSQKHEQLLKKSFSDKNFDQSELAIESSRLGNSIGGVIASGMNKNNANDVLKSLSSLKSFQNSNKENIYWANLSVDGRNKEVNNIANNAAIAGGAIGTVVGTGVGAATSAAAAGTGVGAAIMPALFSSSAAIGTAAGAGLGKAGGTFFGGMMVDKKIKKAKAMLEADLSSFQTDWLGQLKEMGVISDEMRLDLAKTPMTQDIMDALKDMIESQAKSIVGGKVDNILSVNYKLASNIIKEKLSEQIKASNSTLNFQRGDLKVSSMLFEAQQTPASNLLDSGSFSKRRQSFDTQKLQKELQIKEQAWINEKTETLGNSLIELFKNLGLEGLSYSENTIEDFREKPLETLENLKSIFDVAIDNNSLKSSANKLKKGTVEYSDALTDLLISGKQDLIKTYEMAISGSPKQYIAGGEKLNELTKDELTQRIKTAKDDISILQSPGTSTDKEQIISESLGKLDTVSKMSEFTEKLRTELESMRENFTIEKSIIDIRAGLIKAERENLELQQKLQYDRASFVDNMNTNFRSGGNIQNFKQDQKGIQSNRIALESSKIQYNESIKKLENLDLEKSKTEDELYSLKNSPVGTKNLEELKSQLIQKEKSKKEFLSIPNKQKLHFENDFRSEAEAEKKLAIEDAKERAFKQKNKKYYSYTGGYDINVSDADFEKAMIERVARETTMAESQMSKKIKPLDQLNALMASEAKRGNALTLDGVRRDEKGKFKWSSYIKGTGLHDRAMASIQEEINELKKEKEETEKENKKRIKLGIDTVSTESFDDKIQTKQKELEKVRKVGIKKDYETDSLEKVLLFAKTNARLGFTSNTEFFEQQREQKDLSSYNEQIEEIRKKIEKAKQEIEENIKNKESEIKRLNKELDGLAESGDKEYTKAKGLKEAIQKNEKILNKSITKLFNNKREAIENAYKLEISSYLDNLEFDKNTQTISPVYSKNPFEQNSLYGQQLALSQRKYKLKDNSQFMSETEKFNESSLIKKEEVELQIKQGRSGMITNLAKQFSEQLDKITLDSSYMQSIQEMQKGEYKDGTVGQIKRSLQEKVIEDKAEISKLQTTVTKTGEAKDQRKLEARESRLKSNQEKLSQLSGFSDVKRIQEIDAEFLSDKITGIKDNFVSSFSNLNFNDMDDPGFLEAVKNLQLKSINIQQQLTNAGADGKFMDELDAFIQSIEAAKKANKDDAVKARAQIQQSIENLESELNDKIDFKEIQSNFSKFISGLTDMNGNIKEFAIISDTVSRSFEEASNQLKGAITMNLALNDPNQRKKLEKTEDFKSATQNMNDINKLKFLNLGPQTHAKRQEKFRVHQSMAERGIATEIFQNDKEEYDIRSRAIDLEEQSRIKALANKGISLGNLQQAQSDSVAKFNVAQEFGNEAGMADATLEYYETQKKLNEELGRASQYTDQYLVELAKINERIVNFKADLAGSIVGGLNSGLKDGMRHLFDIREREKDKENGIGAAEGFMLRTAGGVLNAVSDRYIQDAADKLTTGLSSLFGMSLEDPEEVRVEQTNAALTTLANAAENAARAMNGMSAISMTQTAQPSITPAAPSLSTQGGKSFFGKVGSFFSGIGSSIAGLFAAKGKNSHLINKAISMEEKQIKTLPEYRNHRNAKPTIVHNFGPKNETIIANDKEYVDPKLGIVLNPQQRQFHNFASGNEPKVRNIDPADLKKLFKAGRNMRGGRDAYKNLSGRALASNKMIQGYGQDLVRLQDYKNAEMTRKTEERYNKYMNRLVNPLKNIVMGDVMGKVGSFIGEAGRSISNWRTNRKLNSEKGMRLEGGSRVKLSDNGVLLFQERDSNNWGPNPELQARYDSLITRQKSGEGVNIGQNLGASSWLSDMYNKAFASSRAKGSSEYELARLTKGEIVKPLDRNIIDQTRKEVVAQNMNFGQDISNFKISQDPSNIEATGTGALLRNKIQGSKLHKQVFDQISKTNIEKENIKNYINSGAVNLQDLTKGGVVKGKYGKDTNVGLIKRDSTIINPKHLNGYYYGKNQPINPTRSQTNSHSNTNNQSSVSPSANTNNTEKSTTNNVSDNTTSNKNVENVDNSTQNTVTNNFEIHVTVNHAGEVKEASVSGNTQMNTDQQELKDKIQNAIIQALAEQRDRPGGEFDY